MAAPLPTDSAIIPPPTAVVVADAPAIHSEPASASIIPTIQQQQDSPQSDSASIKSSGSGAHPSAPLTRSPTAGQVALTILLVSGRRRNLTFDSPSTTTILRAKEVIWNTWPEDWKDEQPPSPGFLRLLYLGKILGDDATLTSLAFAPEPAPPTVVHLSVRPFLPPPDDDLAKSKRGKRRSSATNPDAARVGGDEEAHGGGCCGCIIC